MIGHLGLQRSFQNGLGQLFEQTVFPDDILGPLVVSEQLIDQLLVDCHGFSHFLPPMAVYTVLFTPSPELEALDLRNLRPRVSSRYLVLHWFRADGTQIPLQRQASPKAAIAEYLRPRIHKLFARERTWHQSQRCRDVPVYHGESTLGISN